MNKKEISLILSWILLTITLVIALSILCGCKKPESPPPVPETARKIPFAVTGIGKDLYSVFDAEGKEKVDFTRTNKEISLVPGTYKIILNGSSMNVTIQSDTKEVLEAGSFMVSGTGNDLFYLFDSEGKNKLDFRKTNSEVELFPGEYMVVLNGIKKKVTVQAGKQEIIEAGTLFVAGNGKDLYSVYDLAMNTKLDFRSTGKEIELFPGTYKVIVNDHEYKGIVKAKEKTVITP